MREQVLGFSTSSTNKRREYIINDLKRNGIPYELQDLEGFEGSNIVVKLGSTNEENKITVLGAHYDVFNGSKGMNDNGVAVVTLLEWIKTNPLAGSNKSAEVVFFDKEETGMIGSSVYAEKNKNRIEKAIIFDIIGYGDRLVYGTNSNKIAESLADFEDVYDIVHMLPSDNLGFDYLDIPTALITAAHDEDLEEIAESMYSLKPSAKFYSSFHNRVNDDKIDILNLGLMRRATDLINSLF